MCLVNKHLRFPGFNEVIDESTPVSLYASWAVMSLSGIPFPYNAYTLARGMASCPVGQFFSVPAHRRSTIGHPMMVDDFRPIRAFTPEES